MIEPAIFAVHILQFHNMMYPYINRGFIICQPTNLICFDFADNYRNNL